MVWFGSRAARFTIDNLSLGGARLIGSMALRQGQQIDIELDLDTGPVKLVGEVVRVDTPDLLEDQVAVRFVDPPSDVKAAIRDVVSRRLAASDYESPAATPPPPEDPIAARLSDPVIGKLGDDEDPEIELEADIADLPSPHDPEADRETSAGSRPGGSRPGRPSGSKPGR